MTKETIIKSTLKYLVKRQIEEGSAGFVVDNDPDHDCCWDDVLAWIEAQPCEDCISRQAVIRLVDEASEMHPYKVVGDSDTYSDYNQGWSDACDWLYANIEGVPSVTPQRKRGKWIEVLEHRDEFGSTWHYECSECGGMSYKGLEPLERYCPNCGAYMGGGDETN